MSCLVDRISSSQLGGSLRTAQEIVRSNGGAVTALYRGLTPNLVGNSVSWALYFVCYDKLKHELQELHGRGSRLSYYDFFLASGAAGKNFSRDLCFAPPPQICGRKKKAFLCSCWFYDRSCDGGLDEPDLGDQNAHAVHILDASRRVQFHRRRDAADLPFGRPAGFLSRSGSFPVRRFARRVAVHGVRKAEDGPRRQHGRAAATAQHAGLLGSEWTRQGLCGNGLVSLPGREVAVANVRYGTGLQGCARCGKSSVEA